MKSAKKNRIKNPDHVVLLPDGNRRWAKKRGLPPIEGHLKGFENIKRFCHLCRKRGIRVLTAFGFSTENWDRPKGEVKYLMKLLERGLSEEIKNYSKEGTDFNFYNDKVRVRIIGQRDRLPKSLQKVIKKIEDLTKDNKELVLNLAISYSGRWDIVQAIQRLIREKVPSKKVSEALFNDYLSTAKLPAPDLIIRSGREKRLSNFLLWQAAYSELYFSSKYWPDFNEKDFDKILGEYRQRQRRFGR